MANIPAEIRHEILSDVVSSYLDLAITEPPVISEDEAKRVQAVMLEETRQSIDWDDWEKNELVQPLPPNTIHPLLSVSLQFRLTTLKLISEALGPAALTEDPPGVSRDVWNGLRRARTAYRAVRVPSPATPRPVFSAPTRFLDVYTSFLFSHLLRNDSNFESALWRRLYCRALNIAFSAQTVEKGKQMHDELSIAVCDFVNSLRRSESERLENTTRLRDSLQKALYYEPHHVPSELMQAFRFRYIAWRVSAIICKPPMSTYVFPNGTDNLQRDILEFSLQLIKTWAVHEAASTHYYLP
ncbi:hypothetical protein C8R44DRAFT_972758 [Mycena epipterygia]|nr:hypothetical protein C8R44DRAFT_972758 [Mycena epipterygia]